MCGGEKVTAWQRKKGAMGKNIFGGGKKKDGDFFF